MRVRTAWWSRAHGSAVVALLLMLLMAMCAPALAADDDDDDKPRIRSAPTVAGGATVGSTLGATGGSWVPRPARPSYQWRRCDASGSCSAIAGATSPWYTVTAADAGHSLVVRLRVRHDDEWSDPADSAPTAVVAGQPVPTPTPQPQPQPPVQPQPSPSPTPTTSAGGFTDSGATPQPQPQPQPPAPAAPAPSSGAGVPPAVAPSAPRLMRPFPVVRIAGRYTRSRTTLTLVTVRAPIGARITMRCRKATCSSRSIRVRSKTTRLRALQRSFRRGATIEIRVTARGVMGKVTRIRMVSAGPPVRSDRCLSTRGSVVGCPA